MLLFICIKYSYDGVPQLLVIFVVVVAGVLKCAKQDLWHTMKSMKSGDLQNLHNIAKWKAATATFMFIICQNLYISLHFLNFFLELTCRSWSHGCWLMCPVSISDLQVWSESIHIQLVQHSMKSLPCERSNCSDLFITSLEAKFQWLHKQLSIHLWQYHNYTWQGCVGTILLI